MATKDDIERLFDQAVTNLKSSSILGKFTKGKAFELQVLANLLVRASKDYVIRAIPPKNHPATAKLKFAGNPASANRDEFTHFKLTPMDSTKGLPSYEAWVSVEFGTYSSNKQFAGSYGLSSRHELDVALFIPFTVPYPTYEEVVWASTCKASPITKAQVREALGFRREMGSVGPVKFRPTLFNGKLGPTPCDPPSVLILSSKDTTAPNYQAPVDKLGVDIEYVKFNYP